MQRRTIRVDAERLERIGREIRKHQIAEMAKADREGLTPMRYFAKSRRQQP